MRYTNNLDTMTVTSSLAMSTEACGAMICTRGANIGTSFTLSSDVRVTVGRDPACYPYVVPGAKVSRRHLEIMYIGGIQKYLIMDLSKNGTFLSDGTRLVRNQAYYAEPRTKLYLGDFNTEYQLR